MGNLSGGPRSLCQSDRLTDSPSAGLSACVFIGHSVGLSVFWLTDWPTNRLQTDWLTERQTDQQTDQQTACSDCFIPRIQSFKGLEWRENFSETFKVRLKVIEKGPLFWFSLIGLYIPTFHHIYEVGKFLLFYTWTGALESKVKRLKPLENFPELGQSDKRTDRR